MALCLQLLEHHQQKIVYMTEWRKKKRVKTQSGIKVSYSQALWDTVKCSSCFMEVLEIQQGSLLSSCRVCNTYELLRTLTKAFDPSCYGAGEGQYSVVWLVIPMTRHLR